MALVKRFDSLGVSERRRVHGEVRCGFATFERDGKRYLQLDTFGSNERVIPGKVSQSIQIDREGAVALKALLSHVFPGV